VKNCSKILEQISFMCVSMLLGLEEEFELDIPDDDIPDHDPTISEIVTYIENRIGEAS